MNMKWIGAICVVLSCGGFGWYISFLHQKEEWLIRQLLSALDFMECELQYRLTPLPDLCRQAARQCGNELGTLLHRLAEELESQICPDVGSCMRSALETSRPFPVKTRELLLRLGNSLGRFDLDGQLKGLETLRRGCRKELKSLEQNRERNLRSYQTLGLCAGAALAIILI